MKIEFDGVVIEDTADNLVETKDGIVCGCGNGELKLIMCLDGTDFCQYNYKCKCGNEICTVIKREAMW